MAELICISGEYKNVNAVPNVIRYITRTRLNESRKTELIEYGASGASSRNPEFMIRQFCSIQKTYPSKNQCPRRIHHEVFSLDYEEQRVMLNALDLLSDFALSCCSYYFYEMQHQVVYAIHLPDREKHLHIHFAINTTSYETGRKLHESKYDFANRRAKFKSWFQTYYLRAMERQNIHFPIIWEQGDQ